MLTATEAHPWRSHFDQDGPSYFAGHVELYSLAHAAAYLAETCPSCCAALLAEGVIVDSYGDHTKPSRYLPSHFVAFADDSIADHDAQRHWNDRDAWARAMDRDRKEAARDCAWRD